MTIFVGSTNPVKMNAVTAAAIETWPEIVVHGYEVPSGVPAQPRGNEQTRLGAENRARQALERGLFEHKQTNRFAIETDFLGIGLEGGVFENDQELWSTVWVVVVDTAYQVFAANGARFQIPEVIARRIQAGEEMGPVVEHVVREKAVRQKQGMIGVITRGFVDRTEEYSGIAKMALGLWYGQDWLTHFQK